MVTRETRHSKAIYQCMLDGKLKREHRLAHGFVRGLQNVDAINVLMGSLGNIPDHAITAHECLENSQSLDRIESLRIVQPREAKVLRQHDRGNDNWTGKRSTSRLINPGNTCEPSPPEALLVTKRAGHGWSDSRAMRAPVKAG